MSFKSQWNLGKLRKKVGNGMRGYPVATIAYYGPNAARATKVAVGIVDAPDERPVTLERWRSDSSDVRTDASIVEAILQLFAARGVKSVVCVDRIIGCPHEEGVDYPDGEKCPECPFWANRDRWTGEPES